MGRNPIKVLLIALNPAEIRSNYKSHDQRYTPLGLYALVAFLKDCGINVHHIDAVTFYKSIDEICNESCQFDPDLIGISAVTHKHFNCVVALASNIRKRLPGVHLVVGGAIATFGSEKILKLAPIDTTIRGEGEYALIELCKRLEAKEDFRSIKGLAYCQGDDVILNPLGSRIENLDALPPPDLDYVPKVLAELLSGHRSYVIMGSRGCVGKCRFCQVPHYYGLPGVAWRSPEKVVEEMRHLYEIWGVHRFNFQDANFLAKTEWVKEYIGHLREKIGYAKFNIFANAENLTPGLLNDLKKTGLYRVYVGLETGSARRLERLGKRSTIEGNEHAVEIAGELGIELIPGFMLYYPDSSLEEVTESARWFKRMNLSKLSTWFNKMDLWYGTPEFKRLENLGKVVRTDFASGMAYEFEDRRVGTLFESMNRGLHLIKPAWSKISDLDDRIRIYIDSIIERELEQSGISPGRPPSQEALLRIRDFISHVNSKGIDLGRININRKRLNEIVENLFWNCVDIVNRGHFSGILKYVEHFIHCRLAEKMGPTCQASFDTIKTLIDECYSSDRC